jgi:hypothetical protein
MSSFSRKKKEEPVQIKPEMEECAEGFRINRTLLGRILAIKRNGVIYESTSKVALQSTVERPIDFGSNLYRWLVYVKSERKRLAEELHIKEKSERETKLYVEEERKKKALAERKKFLDEFFRPMKNKQVDLKW